MPIPKPKKSEKQNDFISRTIAFLIDEGKKPDEASAIAYSAWNEAKGIKKFAIEKSIPWDISLDELRGKIENAWSKIWPSDYNAGNYGSVREVYLDGTCIVSKEEKGKGRQYFRYDFIFNADDEVELSNPVEVDQQTEWVEKDVLEKAQWIAKEESDGSRGTEYKDGPDDFRVESILAKADEDQGLIYGIILEPETADSQGDIISKEEITKAAHDFMVGYRGQETRIGEMHKREAKKVVMVENYLAPVDFKMGKKLVKEGSWIGVTKVLDHKNSPIWAKVLKGEYTGYSIAGKGKRTPIED